MKTMKKSKRYTVRFNLGKGKNFMKWRITDRERGVSHYLEPTEVTLTMFGCFLRNQKKAAWKIFSGSNKTVCAWVECDDVLIEKAAKPLFTNQVMYNPRKCPNWVNNQGENIDNQSFDCLLTHDRNVYQP